MGPDWPMLYVNGSGKGLGALACYDVPWSGKGFGGLACYTCIEKVRWCKRRLQEGCRRFLHAGAENGKCHTGTRPRPWLGFSDSSICSDACTVICFC